MTTKTDITLLPCPFCGGEAEIDTHQGYLALGTGRLGHRIAVYCRSCDADMGVCVEDVPDIEPEQVADMWNRRAAVEADRQDQFRDAAKMVTVDDLAQEIRRVDGTQSMGAGAMAEALMPFLQRCAMQMVPSDDDLLGCAGVTRNGGLPSIVGTADIRRFADCVRKHWGSSQPATSEALLDLVSRLRALARYQHDDMSVADEAADALISGQHAASAKPVGPVRLRDEGSEIYLDGVQCRYSIEQGEPWPYSDTLAYAFDPGIAERIVAALNAAPAAQEPVAYLDVGADGYLDLGSDKGDDELSKLPKGRHMLAIIGTYGANGYVSAQVKPDIVELAREGMEVHAGIPNSPEYRVCAELVRVAESAALAAPVAQEPVRIRDDDLVSVPRGLIGAACSAIDGKRDAPNVLTELRRYTTGDLSAPVAQEPVASQWKCPSCGCEHGVAGEPYWTHDRTPHPVESIWRCDRCDATHAIKLIEPTCAAPVAAQAQKWEGVDDPFFSPENMTGLDKDELIRQLQWALNYWMPSIAGDGTPDGERCANDSYLLYGMKTPVGREGDNTPSYWEKQQPSAQDREDALSPAARDVLSERRRQVDTEGWTPEHDDAHADGALALAAACYAAAADPGLGQADAPSVWPWAPEWWKPTDTRRNLVKAGALILAEIERLDRAAARAAKEQS